LVTDTSYDQPPYPATNHTTARPAAALAASF
jgi:hypothetical protein